MIADPIFLPGHLLDRLKAHGEVSVCDSISSSLEELISRLNGADIAMVGHSKLPARVFEEAHSLRYVTLWRTGYDDVDLRAATKHGVAVSNAPGYSNEAVAEHVFALLLSFLRRIPEADYWMREGRFECSTLRGRELKGKTMGVIGTGRIGMRVTEIATCLGMNVLAYDYYPSEDIARTYGFTYADLEALYRESDFITIHLPLTPKTEGMIGEPELNMMKPTAIIINTARGKIIDQDALVMALKKRRISGACLDVFSVEPPAPDDPLLKMDNVILTPHTAFNTIEANQKCTILNIENIEAFLSKKPINVVNPEVLSRLKL